MLSTVIHGLILVVVLVPLLDLFRHWNAVPRLAQRAGPEAGKEQALPCLSVIIPARNEEEGVRAAVSSMIKQDYPNLELVLVNDRSTDRTGEIMAELAAADPDRVRMITVTDLPAGWLGKNHALWLGSKASSGQWLLFADADVLFDPGCFRRAVAYAEAERLDHMALLPQLEGRGYWLQAFIAFFTYGFLINQRPYLANDPKSKVGMGIGAFNLVRRTAYEQIGTHAALPLRPDDDLRLGARIKRAGLRQRIVDGRGLARIDWYPSLPAMIRGFEKNMFAGLNYRVPAVVLAVFALLLLNVYPFMAVWLFSGLSRWLLLGIIGLDLATFVAANKVGPARAWLYAPAFPLLATLFAYTIARSAALALARGGVEWRGTRYSLAELRKHTGLE